MKFIMNKSVFKKAVATMSALLALGQTATVAAHSGGGVIDGQSNNPSATDLAVVTCYDDGSGTPHRLFGQVKDMSSPVSGLFLNFHIYKGTQMISITDTVSGDASYSQGVQLNGGAGDYYISVSKTNAGARIFDVIWHCMTAGGAHTGTQITVLQIQ